MINNIVFYNHYHNGDVFATKGYVQDIIANIPNVNYYYLNNNSNKLLADLPIIHGDIKYYSLNDRAKYFIDGDNLFINTWVGSKTVEGTGVNWESYYLMFEEIYQYLNEIFPDANLKLKDKNYYIPTTNYEFFQVPSGLTLDYNNTIIFSNGPVMSGQTNLYSTEYIVTALLNKFPEKKLILTHRSSINHSNILYTSDLIGNVGSDLNEISWLAERCKYILGRNSGPFCFMHTKKILNDESKKIVAFGNTLTDCFVYNMHVDSNYKILLDEDQFELVQAILKFFGDENE